MFLLHVMPAEGPAFEHAFEGETLTIGRSSSCNLVIADRFMSRTHARLVCEGGQLFVEDLGSRNGTQLNGTLVTRGGPLRPGDAIRLSGSVITIGEAQGAPEQTGGGAAGYDQSVFRSADEILRPAAPAGSDVQTGIDLLRRLTDRIKLVTDVHHALCSSLDAKELLELLLDRVFQHLRPEDAAVFLRRPGGELYRAASRAAPGVPEAFLSSRTLAREVADKGQSALVLDARVDDRFARAGSILGAGVRSLIAAPLLDPAGSQGMIVLASRMHVRQFSEEDMELLTSVASAAALRLRNLALAHEAAERQRLEKELALARQIQLALLPVEMPTLAGYELAGGNIPSRLVSGDYFKVGPRNEGRECVLMVADVAGKGIAASLLTAALEALATGPIEDGLPPAEIFVKVSRLLYQRTPPQQFATALLAVLDLASGELTYTNAGHNPAFVVRCSGQVDRLQSTGLPLGVLPAAAYRSAQSHLAPGDTLVIYTDGITEAANPADEEYGLDRLIELCREHGSDPLPGLERAIREDLERFAAGTPFADDRTLVLVRRLKPGNPSSVRRERAEMPMMAGARRGEQGSRT